MDPCRIHIHNGVWGVSQDAERALPVGSLRLGIFPKASEIRNKERKFADGL